MQRFYLSPGDRIIIPKSPLGLVQHHAIYDGDGHVYENKFGFGVVRTPLSVFFNNTLGVTEVRRFQGTDVQLRFALNRAKNLLGRPYHLVRFNCEHFADYVQWGRSYSKQVVTGLSISAAALAVLVVIQFARK